MLTPPSTIKLLSPAKVNLFLHITGRRADGYHHLQTIFQLLNYGDELQFTKTPTDQITLTCNCPNLANDENLILKAARLLKKHTNTHIGVNISLNKILPMGAGLGGGSSNAASTLLALNELWKTNLPHHELAAIGLKLGADVPVFIYGKSGWAEGVGEIITPMSLPKHWYLVLTPPCQVSTKEIFCHEQLTRNSSRIKIAAFEFQHTRNDCEKVAKHLYPEIQFALDWLRQYAPARMTGTGSSVFASFKDKKTALRVMHDKPEGLECFIAQGCNAVKEMKTVKQ